MFLPVKNMIQHIESILLIQFKEYYCWNKIHTLTIPELRKGGSNCVKNWSHFTCQLFDILIFRKSSVKIEIDLLTLVFAFIERVWFEGFQDKFGPDLFSERIWYAWSDMVDENSFIGLLEIFYAGNDVLFPSLKLVTDFFVIYDFEKDLLREVISPEPVLIVNGFGPLFGRLH